ncbi:kinase [Segatella maculosa]|uniref:kinase n=1 Tax=Segatella maculosa TaxID=439703 RepID=UPI003CD0C4CC
MEYYHKMLCVTREELCMGTDPVMKQGTFNTNLYRGHLISVNNGGGEGNYTLYAWTSLPEKYRKRYVERYGDPEQKLKEAMLKDRVKLDGEAREWYEAFIYEKNGRAEHLTDELIEEYTINASVLGELLKMMAQRQAIRQSLNGSMAGAWEIICQSAEAMREEYHHTLPQNPARLKAKIKAFKTDGYGSLISGKIGNRNTQKITDVFGRLLIALKRSRVPVYTDAQLFEEGNRRAVENGWKPLKSLSGMKRWLYSPAIEPLWYDAVYGEQATRQKYGRKHRTALPTKRDALWYGDGTKLNLYYQDEDGKVRTTQVYVVIDAMSEVMLGWHISDSEDYEAQYHAYRMAIQTGKHKPYEIVHDNQGGHKKLDTDGLFKKLCHVHRTTQPYNGESKTIEAVFGRFQQQVLHKDWRFTGQNITAKKMSSRPNLEFIEANKDSLYTLAELKDAYAKATKEWNDMQHPAYDMSRREAYEGSVNEETPEVTAHDMVNMFWVTAKRMSTFTDQGICITIKNEKRQYEVMSEPGIPDHEWRRQHTYERFVVKYDPYDFASIRLYKKEADGSLRFERVAEPYLVIHRAIQEQTEGEAAFIRQEQTANTADRIERTVAGREIEREHGLMPEQHGLRSPKPKGMTAAERRQIERRTGIYSRQPEEYKIGRKTKQLSLEDWANIETTTVDMASVAGKL